MTGLSAASASNRQIYHGIMALSEEAARGWHARQASARSAVRAKRPRPVSASRVLYSKARAQQRSDNELSDLRQQGRGDGRVLVWSKWKTIGMHIMAAGPR